MGTALAAAADVTAPPPGLEYKAAGPTGVLLGADDEKGIVECLVSVTGIVDEQGDIIVPGAYAETLASRKSKGVRFHDWTRMCAKTLIQEEWLPGDSRLPATLPNGSPWPPEAGALYIKGQYNLEIRDGQEGYSNAKFYAEEGQWSIGYKPTKSTAYRRKGDGARVLPKVELYEWSDVLHGAAPQTSTLGVKTAEDSAGGFGQGIEQEQEPSRPGADWLQQVLGEKADSVADDREAEQTRRDQVEAAFNQERSAERRRRDSATRAIGAATGNEKAKLQNAETQRRGLWQAAFDDARDTERKRRSTWAAGQRSAKAAEHADLDADLGLGIDDDAINDDAGETAGKEGEPVEIETKVRDVLPGSFEERRDAVREAARAALQGPKNADGYYEWWVYVIGTWADRVVVSRSPRGDGASETWQIPYTVADTGTISLGEMVRVELVAQVVPATKSGQMSAETATAVGALIEDAAGALAMAVTAQAGQVGDGDVERLAELGGALVKALGAAGVSLTAESVVEPAEGDVAGEADETTEVEEKTVEEAVMVLDFSAIQAQMDDLRAAV